MREQAPGDGVIDELEDERTETGLIITPRYPSERWRALGEHLASLYAARDRAQDAPERDRLDGEIAVARARMRKGTRLHAGEFLEDGRFRLLDRLGDAPSAERWLALDRATDALVTLEVMHGRWVEDPEVVKAFVEHAHALAAVSHPRVAPILGARRTDEEFLYLASAFTGLLDLPRAVQEGSVEEVDALQIAVELAEGLGAVHQAGLTHGAVSPAAVLLSEDGAAHLTGFRLVPDPASSLYAAPESMEAHYVPSAAADVYGLGMTLAFALHGADLPFWVLRDAERLIADLPTRDTVREALRRATAWDPEARPASVGALAEMLLGDDVLVADLAERAWQRGRFRVAAGHYERLLALRPADSVILRQRLGEVYLRLGAHDAAFEHLTTALEQGVVVGTVQEAERTLGPILELLRDQAGATEGWERLARALWELARKLQGARRALIRTELARINQHELQDGQAAAETWYQVLADHHTPKLARTALEALAGLAEARGDWAEVVARREALLPYMSAEERPAVEFAIGRACIEHLDREAEGLRWIDQAEAAGHRTLELAERLEEIRARRGQWHRVIDLMQRQAEARDAEQVSRVLLRAGLIARSVHLDELARQVYEQLLERIPGHVVALRELARMHYRAGRRDEAVAHLEALAATFTSGGRGKRKTDDGEAGERAADLLTLAQLHLETGQTEAALQRLEQALALQPDLVPALERVAPLHLAHGRVEAAGRAWERLFALHRTNGREAQRHDACLGLGDVAWVQGKLAMALGWYNRALEAGPQSPEAWWGVARTALAARGGHAGVARAPWLRAVPGWFTAPEALARLLAGMLDVDAMRAWLARTALGSAFLAGGDAPIRVALAVVDVLRRNGLVDHALFDRLSQARPGWAEAVDQVRADWFSEAALEPGATYVWSASALPDDFDGSAVRAPLPLTLEQGDAWGSPPDSALLDDDAWETLFAGDGGQAPVARAEVVEEVSAGPADGARFGVLERGGLVVAVLAPEAERIEVPLPDGGEGGLVLERVGSAVYLRAGSPVHVDGDPTEQQRLHGDERLEVGEIALDFRLTAEPPVVEAPEEPAAAEEPVPADAPEEPVSPEPPITEAEEPVPSDEPVAAEASDSEVPDAPEATPDAPVAAEPSDEPVEPAPDAPVAEAAPDAPVAEAAPVAPAEPDAPDAPVPLEPSEDAPYREPVVREWPPDGVEEEETTVVALPSDFGDDDEAAEGEDDEVIEPARRARTPTPNPAARHASAIFEAMQGALAYGSPPPLLDDPSEAAPRPPAEGPAVVEIPAATPPPEEPAPAPSAAVEVSGDPSPDEAESQKTVVVAVPAPPEPSPSPVRAIVEVMSGPARGSATEVSRIVRIGSSPDTELPIIGDTRLDAHHCSVERTESGFVLRDAGSGTGTVMNGSRVTETDLSGGEIIMIGRSVLRFRRIEE